MFNEKNSGVVREAVAAAVEQMTVTMEELVKKIMRPSMRTDAMAAERITAWNAQVRSILENYYFFFQKEKTFHFYFFRSSSTHSEPLDNPFPWSPLESILMMSSISPWRS